MKIDKETAKRLCAQRYSLREKPELLVELVEWMKNKDLSVHQAEDLMASARNLFEMSCRTEKIEITI